MKLMSSQSWIVKLLILGLMLIGCAHPGVRFDAKDGAFADIRQAIINSIGKPRMISESQREFWSEYYPKKPDKAFDANKSRERYYTVATILNDARPYVIQVEVIREVRRGPSFEEAGVDLDMSSKAAEDIFTKLNEGRGRRNVIDDFRAF